MVHLSCVLSSGFIVSDSSFIHLFASKIVSTLAFLSIYNSFYYCFLRFLEIIQLLISVIFLWVLLAIWSCENEV